MVTRKTAVQALSPTTPTHRNAEQRGARAVCFTKILIDSHQSTTSNKHPRVSRRPTMIGSKVPRPLCSGPPVLAAAELPTLVGSKIENGSNTSSLQRLTFTIIDFVTSDTG